jgi:hypothetical protein
VAARKKVKEEEKGKKTKQNAAEESEEELPLQGSHRFIRLEILGEKVKKLEGGDQ